MRCFVEGVTPVDTETVAPLCDRNSGRQRFNVNVVGKHLVNGYSLRVVHGQQLHHHAPTFP